MFGLEAVQTSDSCAGKIAILSIQPFSNIIYEAMTWRVCVDLILSGLSYRFANAQNICRRVLLGHVVTLCVDDYARRCLLLGGSLPQTNLQSTKYSTAHDLNVVHAP